MKRREFLSASLLAVTTATVPHVAVAQSAFAPSQTYPVGDFILGRTRSGLQVTHKSRPDHVIWETPSDGEFIVAERATADIRSFGTPEGSFEIYDTVSASYEKPTIDAVVLTGAAVRVTGRLTGTTGKLGYQLTFEAVSSAHLRFVLTAVGPNASAINRMRLLVGSTADEALFGFGQQLTYFNQKGHVLPMLVQEHGVGRGQPIITQLVDLIGDRGGGTPYTTECPAPHFISSRLRSMFLENLEYSVFDLRPVDRIDIKVWSPVMTGRILYGSTPLDLIEAYTQYAGACAPSRTGFTMALLFRFRVGPRSSAASFRPSTKPTFRSPDYGSRTGPASASPMSASSFGGTGSSMKITIRAGQDSSMTSQRKGLVC